MSPIVRRHDRAVLRPSINCLSFACENHGPGSIRFVGTNHYAAVRSQLCTRAAAIDCSGHQGAGMLKRWIAAGAVAVGVIAASSFAKAAESPFTPHKFGVGQGQFLLDGKPF